MIIMNKTGKIITYALGATMLASAGAYLAMSKEGKAKIHNMVGNIAKKKINIPKDMIK